MLKPCEEWNERISAYLDEECTQRECAQVERHLAACPACRAAAELARCDAQDAAAALAARGAAEDFADKVLSAVNAVPAQRPHEEATARRDIERAFSGNASPPKRLNRFRWAEWLVATGVLGVLAVMVFPIFGKSRMKAMQFSCLANQRSIMLALQTLAVDNDEVMPSLHDWVQRTSLPPEVFQCPKVEQRERGAVDYAYNEHVAGRAIAEFPEPHATIVTFDAKRGMPDYRHNNLLVASYLDGHVQIIGRQDAKQTSPATEASRIRLEAMPATAPPATEAPTIAPPDRNYGLADRLQIAYRASVSLRSEDVQGALERTEMLFRRFDGFVLTSNYQRANEGSVADAKVSGRVPSEKLGEMLVEIGKLGTLGSRSVNGEDLTATHLANLEKLTALAGAQGNLERIGAGAKKTTDALTVEAQRGTAAGEAGGTRVEEYKLKSRVTLAEVSVTITSPPPPVVEEPERLVRDAFFGSLRALGAFGKWLAVAGVALAPWLLVLGPLLGLVLLARRRARK